MTNVDTLLNDPGTAGVWSLDPDRSTVGFSIKNFWGLISVKGRFTDVSADGHITGKGAIFGRLDIQVASLRTGIGKRDEHLRSADFFDAERYPADQRGGDRHRARRRRCRRSARHRHASKGSPHPCRCRSRSARSTTAPCGCGRTPRSTGLSSAWTGIRWA